MKNEKTQKKIGLRKILINLLIAIGVIAYLIGVNLVCTNFSIEVFNNFIKISTVVLVLIGIILLEVSYKKDDGLIGWRAIEILIIAAYSLSIKHIIQTFNFEFESYIMESICAFSIYYLLKSFIQYTIVKKKDLKDLSDISDIVKDQKPVKKEATKRKKAEIVNDAINEDKTEEPVKKITSTRKKATKSSTTKRKTKVEEIPEIEEKVEEKPVKKTTTRKRKTTTTKKSDEAVEKEQKTTTRKSTTRKSTTTKKSTTKATTKKTTTRKTTKKAEEEKPEEIAEEVKPKRRGRPRKEVTKND